MGWVVAVSSSFKFGLSVLLIVTTIPKILWGGGISNPEYVDIVNAATEFFVEEGFQVSGQVQFAGMDALLAINDECLMYVVPVAHQGWHQAAIRHSVGPDQSLWFEFEGEIKGQKQDTFYPLTVYYFNKAARYFGFKANYPPLFAIVTEGNCSVKALNWRAFPAISFKSVFVGG